MRNPTELMRSILTNKTAQKMIDYVSPIYGNSYVGLWLFQAIGTVLDDVYELSTALRHEANPATATLLLDMWEDHYNLPRAPHLSVEQRRERIVSKLKTRGACNPAKMAAAVSAALGGVEVEVEENTAKNTFTVIVLEPVESLFPAIAVIDRMKPAHLIYTIRVEIRAVPTADIKPAVAVTYAEMYTLHNPSEIYVDGETLVANNAGVSVDVPAAVFPAAIAGIDGETLTIM